MNDKKQFEKDFANLKALVNMLLEAGQKIVDNDSWRGECCDNATFKAISIEIKKLTSKMRKNIYRK